MKRKLSVAKRGPKLTIKIKDEISEEEFEKLPDKDDEERVREILEKEFGKKLPKKRVQIGNYTHEFDIFADDKTIIGEVKSGKCLQKNGKIKPYRFAELCLDCLYLMSVEAEKKLLILTNKEMYKSFKKMIVGFPIKDIEIRLIELVNPLFG